MRATGRQVADDAARAGPEVFEWVLRIDAALNGMPLPANPTSANSACTTILLSLPGLQS